MIQDDIFNCKEDVIVHQTNCMGVMGSGIAKQLRDKYPEVYKAYYYFCKNNKAEDIVGTSLICEANNGKYIANAFGQIGFGTDKQYTIYDALEKALKEVAEFAEERNLTVAIPYKIGCGKGGGDWEIVSEIIERVIPKAEIYRKD